MSLDPTRLRLCLVTDADLAGPRRLVDVAAAAVRGGATMVQLRDKTAATRDLVAQARALVVLLAPLGVPLVVNDRVDVALAAGAQGVHVGQGDMAVADVRRLVEGRLFVGLSVTRLDQVDAPDALAADYLGVGPVFAQTTKLDAAVPLGLEGLATMCRAASRPCLAIGGVDATNAASVLACGVEGLAVVSAIMAADDAEGAARAFGSALA